MLPKGRCGSWDTRSINWLLLYTEGWISPLPVCLYRICVILSDITRIQWDCMNGRNAWHAFWTSLSSRRFMCIVVSWSIQLPCTPWLSMWAPQPNGEASVVILEDRKGMPRHKQSGSFHHVSEPSPWWGLSLWCSAWVCSYIYTVQSQAYRQQCSLLNGVK